MVGGEGKVKREGRRGGGGRGKDKVSYNVGFMDDLFLQNMGKV